MKKFRFLTMAAAVALMLGACSDDNLKPGGSDENRYINPEEGVYMTVSFDLPAAGGTRSFTNGDNSSNSGVEIGSAAENKVGDVLIVLAVEKNNNGINEYPFIASALVPEASVIEVGTTGRTYKSTSKFTKTAIAQFYDSDLFDNNSTDNPEICVFVFCNPTKTLIEKINGKEGIPATEDQPAVAAVAGTAFKNTTWVNYVAEYDVKSNTKEEIWADNAFLMGNSSIAKRLFPLTMKDWDSYTTEAMPFNLSGINEYGRPNEVDNFNEGKGNVSVERAAARFDFRDGSVDGIGNEDQTYNGIGNQTYKVVLDSEGAPLINVKLGKMSFVNMDKSFYFLKRVSPNGLNVNYTLCGAEKRWYSDANGTPVAGTGNYVVDASASWKVDDPLPNTGFAAHFNYPFFDESGKIDNVDLSNDRWSTSVITDVLNGTKNDNPETWNPESSEGGLTYPGYKVWRYSTENTIPADAENQRNGISTGVVFKGQLLPAREATDNDDQPTKDLLNALVLDNTLGESSATKGMTDPILYMFAGHVYCHWTNMRDVALSLAITNIHWEGEAETGHWAYTITRSSTLYNAVFGTGGFGEYHFTYQEKDKEGNNVGDPKEGTIIDDLAADVNSANYKYDQWKKTTPSDENFTSLFAAFQTTAVAKKITLYQRSYDEKLGGWGYYCYYYYWNRHNDNGQNGVMGPMEFAVVRNNVYKLAVTKIARLGHPRIAANDPDKPTPNTPDEKSDVYITVTCTVLPWVVRVNNIEF